MPRFICKHGLARYLKATLEKGHEPGTKPVKVIRFFPSEDGTVVCEVDAPSRGVFREWIASTGYACCEGEYESVEDAEWKV